MEFDETPRFWYPRIALDVWINFSSSTVELRSSECRENLHFCFSLSIRFIFFPPSVCFPSFFFLLPYPLNFPLFVCSHPISFFSFLSFSHFFFSSLSFPSFSIFYFLFLIWIASIKWSKSGGNFPPLSSIPTCHQHHFSINFLIFLFPLFPSFDTWPNVSHSHKCTT